MINNNLPKPGLTGNHIQDSFGRTFNYLRIAVCERCNLRCVYCMPEKGIKFSPAKNILNIDEIKRIVNILSGEGVSKIRFTGGEPLMRNDLVQIVKNAVSTKNVDSVHITTNGIFLSDKIYQLKEAGLHGLNISLDTLKSERFEKIARRPGFDLVIKSLDMALEAGFQSVKINMVVMRSFNEDEIPDFVELTRKKNITVRFIELMPFDAHQIWKTGHYFGVELMQNMLNNLYPELHKANGSSTEQHVYRIPGYKGKIALIPSYTRSLCGDCSRIRLTADGKIRNCLYAEHEYDVLKLIRSGASDDEIAQFFKDAMWKKLKDGWEAQRKSNIRQRDSMTQIGG